MKILKQEKGVVKLLLQSPEDLWYLSHIIDPSDSVRASTERKLKIGGIDARNQKVVRKKMTLTLCAEKVELTGESLRVLGTITDGPEDVARGEYHSFTLIPTDQVTITKNEWNEWHKEKLHQSTQSEQENILVVLFDREEALFAQLTAKGHRVLSQLKGDVQKKQLEGHVGTNHWQALINELKTHEQRLKPGAIIMASPAFWKEYVENQLGELKQKTVFATVSTVDESALGELLKRPELKSALSTDRSAKELQAVEELLTALATDKAAYGYDDVEEHVNQGALKDLLISEEYIKTCREDGTYERLDNLIKNAQATKAKIMFISTHEAQQQLEGLGGIAGTKRW